MIKKTLHSMLLSFAFLTSYEQTCPNINLSNGDFQGWIGTMTNYSATIEQQGTPPFTGGANVGDRFTLIDPTSAFPDPNTCNNVMSSPPNGNTCVKLGNELVGCKQDVLEYTVSVTPDNNLLLYQYAIVLEDPGGGHIPANRPRFVVEIIEKSSGNLVDATCGVYEDYAGPFDGLRTCGSIFYRAWTTTGIDLSAYQNLTAPNNEVIIRFKTHDCGLCGHFGYAYVTAECAKLEIETTYCENTNIATVKAPEGFSYLWDSGEFSQEIQIQNPVIGQQVGVTLTSRQGCVSYITSNITSVNITSNFNVPPPVCELDSINFSDLSLATDFSGNNVNISDWEWVFGDGDTSRLANPTHLYSTPGIYSVKLKVTADGCTDTKIIPIAINPQPVSEFTFNNVCENISIDLINNSFLSTGNISNTNWDFGDNTTSTLFSPSKKYTSSGEYKVKLIATSDSGCISEFIDTISIFQTPNPIMEMNQFCLGSPTNFINNSIPNADSINYWLWDRGDNTPLSTLENNSHTYLSAGDYRVSLTVTNSDNCVNISYDTITIVDFSIEVSSDTSCHESITSFKSNSSSNIQSIEWHFGDSTTSNLNNPTHLYSNPGQYATTVSAINDIGCVDSSELIIIVNENPFIAFNPDKYFGCTPLCISLNNFSYSNDSIVKYEWDIANELFSDISPSLCIEDTGYHNITLTATTLKGCSTKLTKDSVLYVDALPIASYELSDSVLDFFNTKVQFENTSILYDSILWEFYNNSTYSEESLSHIFPEAENQNYIVCLSTITDYGCFDSICKTITVKGDLFYIPNSFTPDGNNTNETFSPVFKGVSPDNYKFYIYNRWGELIFYTENPNNSWDGTHKGRKVKTDVYIWKIEFNTINRRESNLKYGHVSVIYSPTIE